MKERFGQRLTEEEDRGYIPNRKLQLTQKAEIVRLKKVIEEKNALIDKFKKYDEERKLHYSRFEQNYEMMEEQYNEWRSFIDDELGEKTVKKFEKLKKEYQEKKAKCAASVVGLNEVEQALPKLIAMLREMYAFAETRSTTQETFYKTKLGSAMAYVDRLLTKVVGYTKSNEFNEIDK